MESIDLGTLFQNARTHNVWLDRAVSDETLRRIHETMQWGPTSVNSLPARIVFLRAGPEKDKLLSCLMPGNVDKTKMAPVTAILGYDLAFYENLPRTFPQVDAKAWFSGNPEFAKQTAEYNSALQHAYFIIAARAAGLDCGPMAGFDKAKVDELFFTGTTWRSSLICNLGYGDATQLFPRNPRLRFEEACQIRA